MHCNFQSKAREKEHKYDNANWRISDNNNNKTNEKKDDEEKCKCKKLENKKYHSFTYT